MDLELITIQHPVFHSKILAYTCNDTTRKYGFPEISTYIYIIYKNYEETCDLET